MKVLVTGAEGFVGTHLCAALERRGHTTIATSAAGNVGTQLLLPQLDGLRKLLLSTRPDAVVHLAGIAFVPRAHREPAKTYEVNVEGTANLYRTVQDVLGGCLFLFVSSAGVYGNVAPEQQPIDEQCPPRPINVYGWSKWAAEASLQTLSQAYDAPLVIVRPFNHTGPGQAEEYVLPAFARQLADIERGGDPVLHVGNLDVRRDILDVRDVVEAYIDLLECTNIEGTFNIASGNSYALRDLLQRLREDCFREVEVVVDPARLRPNDLMVMVGNATALHAATGWTPKISIDETLRDLMSCWRSQQPSS